jgi:HNH endonuclease.
MQQFNNLPCNLTLSDPINKSNLYISRIAVMISQCARCYVTDQELTNDNAEIHHRTPRQFGGGDVVANLVYLEKRVHHLIHTDSSREYIIRLAQLNLNEMQIRKVDQLMYEIHSRV